MLPNGRAVVLLVIVGCGLLVAAGGSTATATLPETPGESVDLEQTVAAADADRTVAMTDADRTVAAADRTVATTDAEPTEEAYLEPVPEPGDSYFEAEASDGSWISYINPRDEYRDPYLGGGSGKVCVTLLNERGEPIVGESVPDTTVTVPTGDSLEWHTAAGPFVVEYPLTEAYERPLDADQFGTHPDLPQGDGYFDSHCLEWHGLPEDGTVEYGEVDVDGEGADRIEVVGYHQQAHEAWDSDVDPIDDATSYAEAGGGWTYRTDASHGQAVVVLQLTEEEVDDDASGADDGAEDDSGDETDDADGGTNDADGRTDDDADDSNGADGDDGATTDDSDDGATTDDSDDGAATDDSDDVDGTEDADRVPGFGLLLGGIAVGAVVATALVTRGE